MWWPQILLLLFGGITFVLALPLGEKQEEVVLRLALHVQKTSTGAKLVVQLEETPQTASYIREPSKSLLTLSTDLPVWKTVEKSGNDDGKKMDEKDVVQKQILLPILRSVNSTNQQLWQPVTPRVNQVVKFENVKINISSHLPPQSSTSFIKRINRTITTEEVMPKLEFKIRLGNNNENSSLSKPTAIPFQLVSSGRNNTTEPVPSLWDVDKAVADQGFGVLASRCASFAPGLVSDGAGGCTKPASQFKRKHGTILRFKADDVNELHSDAKPASDDLEVVDLSSS